MLQMIEIVSGNFLEAQVEALVNTVNTEGAMGKGIALQFRRAFPSMFKAYLADCRAGAVRLGKMNVFDLGGLLPSGPSDAGMVVSIGLMFIDSSNVRLR
jgi:O-acetyl-ADP-ribose deacetylase (regulator of RNase III)